MHLFKKLNTIKKLTSLLLIFNFLTLTGVIAYHYHVVNISNNEKDIVEDYFKQSNNSLHDYSYLDCPVYRYASTGFNVYPGNLEEISTLKHINTLNHFSKNTESYNTELSYLLRAPPILL